MKKNFFKKLITLLNTICKNMGSKDRRHDKNYLVDRLIIESLTKEIVILKYQLMLLSKKMLGSNWKEFIEKTNTILPDNIFQKAIQDQIDMCSAQKLIDDIFKNKKHKGKR